MSRRSRGRRSCPTAAHIGGLGLPASTVIVAALLWTAGCATPGRLRHRDCGDQLSREDLRTVGAGLNAWQAIRLLRPSFLRSRAPATPTLGAPPRPIVVVDDLPPGDFTLLYSVHTADIARIQHFSGPEATTRYGTGAVGGAIVITTRGGPNAEPPSCG